MSDNYADAKIAIIYRNDDAYSQGIRDAFKAEAADKGLSVVYEGTFTNDTASDFSVQLTAAQTAGASAGSMISPSKIILGTTAGGVPGEEGTVLRFTLLTAAILTLVTGVICWIIL